jgi:crotonobetaine/carnitine-CoA ligase
MPVSEAAALLNGLDELPLLERVVGKILARQARALGSRNFVCHAGEWRSYSQMNARANRVANAFGAGSRDTAEIMIGRGARVALLLSNRLEFLDWWFGLSKIGAIHMPINCEYLAPQIAQALIRSPMELVVTERSLVARLHAALELLSAHGQARPRVLVVEAGEYAAAVGAADEAEPGDTQGAGTVSGADAGVIMSTSGTTGASKGVVLSHAQQYILGRNIARHMELRAADRYYNFFPLFHNTAQAMITLPVMLCGASMVMGERFSASRFWGEAAQSGCTAFYYIGEIIRILLKTSAASGTENPFRVAWGIGAGAGDMQEFEQRFGVKLLTGYGSTEANVPCFVPRHGGKRGSVGRVLQPFEIRVAGAGGESLGNSEVGEILVRSAEPHAVMLGYDGNAQATVNAWRDLWLHTGDTGYLDAEGDLFFAGRLNDAIRVRGEHVSSFEVEEAIARLPGVCEVAAVAVPGELGGDEVKAVIVLAAGAGLTPLAVVEHARERLPRYAVPRYVEFVEALPKTATNKVQKHLLRASGITAAVDCLGMNRTLRKESHV